MSARGMLAADGACKTFDAAADGFGRAEAINAVYLKPLAKAIQDRSPIRAIIRGSAVNNDGKSAGFSVPSLKAQQDLIRQVYRVAGIDECTQTPFIECHGTGTSVGDPIEASSVAGVYGHQKVFIGSVKPNVGHSEGASGLTSFIKATLAVERGIIPPNIRFKTPNPKIPFGESGLTVPTEPVTWPADRPVRAGINSFGLGGVNAHAVVESASQVTPTHSPVLDGSCGPSLLLFSANTQRSLTTVVSSNQSYFEDHPQALPDLAYTLAARRAHLPHRTFSVVVDGTIVKTSPQGRTPEQPPDIVMVFTGQGAQWPGMGAELLETNRAFRDSVHMAEQIIQELPEAPGWSVAEELRRPGKESNLYRSSYSQPICTVLQVALVDALAELNVRPLAVVGHSSGELAAAYASGRLTAREAIVCAFYRGLVSERVQAAGAMASVAMGKHEATPFLEPRVVVACENSPMSVTISGDDEAVDKTIESIRKAKPQVMVRKLRVDTAYHSSHMSEVGGRYKSLLEGHLRQRQTNLQSPVSYASSVTGALLRESETLDAGYWKDNVECPVQFLQAVEAILDSSSSQPLLFLEVGPHAALSGPLRQIFDRKKVAPKYTSCLYRSRSGAESFLSLVGELYTQKQPLDFNALTDPEKACKVLTNVPTYPWDRATTRLYEPRSIGDWKRPRYPRHELLGLRVTYSTDDQPSWRNVLFYHHVPWIYEHLVTGNAVFPAAGYIAMAIEAVRQATTPKGKEEDKEKEKERGFQIRNMSLTHAMILDRYNTVEIITSLVRQDGGSWYQFCISSHNGVSWVQHCAGDVRRGCSLALEAGQGVDRDLPRSVDASSWYGTLSKAGVHYGAPFRGVQAVRASTASRYASTRVVSTVEDTAYYPIHPTKLDACFQTVYAALYQGLEWKIGQLPVPVRFGEISIVDCDQDLVCTVSAEALKKGAIRSHIEARQLDGTMVLHLDDALCLPPGKQDLVEEGLENGARLHWGEQLDFLVLKDLIKSPPQWRDNAVLLSSLTDACIQEILSRLDKQDVSPTTPHLRRYHAWLRAQEHRIQQSPSSGGIEQLAGRALATSSAPCATATLKVVDNIIPLSRGQVHPVELLMGDKTLLDMYDYLNLVDRAHLFQVLGHHHPGQRVLEIGAGTGGTTAKILPQTMYSTYTFTDISAGFFPAARSRLKAYPNITFKTLDITKDPASQGFSPGSFDLVVASNVLHATPSLHQTLVHVRQLLHPRGKLVLEELCGDVKYANIVTGVLSGWWAGEEDDRADEPYVGPRRWEMELQDAGFQGIEDLAYDTEPPLHNMMYILASPRVDNAVWERKQTVLLADAQSAEVAVVFQKQLRSRGYSVSIQGLDECLPESVDVIVLVDTLEPFFHHQGGTQLAMFQGFLRQLQKSNAGALWVTRPSQVACRYPRYSQTIGVARTSRTEFAIDLATCEVDTMTYDSVAKTIDVFEQFQARHQTEPRLREMEYVIHDGSILVGRLLPFSMQRELEAEQSTFCRMESAISFDSDAATWVLSPRQSTLGEDQVEIDIDTAGVSYLDAMAASDTTLPSTIGLGLDAAGVVRRVGSQVSNLLPGDRVMACCSGCFSTSITVQQGSCVKIPDRLSLQEASTMPSAFMTAMHCLLDVGQLDESQSVLIHGASGGVGSAAIQLCQMLGATLYATVGDDEKAEHLVRTYGISRENIFSSRDASFVHGIREVTGGRGLSLVLNTLSGDLHAASYECVAPLGRLINLATGSRGGDAVIPSRLFLRNISHVTIDMVSWLRTRHAGATRLLKRIVQLYSEGKIRPLTCGRVFPARSLPECLEYVQTRQHIGKTLLSFREDESLPKPCRSYSSMTFREDASYLLVGGLGGLGGGLARWMAENQARHLVFLSRSAGADAHQDLFGELKSKGCTVTCVAGRVCNPEDIQRAILASPVPIRGIFNLSMVLQDASLLAMSPAEWRAATEPKVQDTWSLHEASENLELDCFVLFSSLCGIIGMPGQANYASANTFMDAFVQYRHHRGLPASVVDVGAVEGIGWTAKNPETLERSKWLEGAKLSQRELFQAITIAIHAPRSRLDSRHGVHFTEASHVMNGFRQTPGWLDALRNGASFLDRRLAAYMNRESQDEGADAAGAGHGKAEGALQRFVAALPASPDTLDSPEARAFLATEVAKWIFDLLLKPTEDDSEIDLNRSFADIGLDSLAAVELRTWWKATLGLDISVLEIMSCANLAALGERAARGLSAKLKTDTTKQ